MEICIKERTGIGIIEHQANNKSVIELQPNKKLRTDITETIAILMALLQKEENNDIVI